MTNKKKNNKNEKEEEIIKTSINNEFDLDTTLKELECPEMFKYGLKMYIELNKIKITNQKDFDKILKKYSEVSM